MLADNIPGFESCIEEDSDLIEGCQMACRKTSAQKRDMF